MGYSTQGKNAHESLVARQDSEIRLLELMRRCLLQKVKCDREYASAIASVAQQGLKIDKTDELNGSQVLQAWKKFMEEMENQSKLIRTNTENLENVCNDRMSQMCQERRKLKKQYQEEHAKIASRFYQLTEDVARKKAEYQKHLEYYKQMRMRFEEHYIKSGRAGRKLDDVRDKYQKACRKLHLTHNEYVLLLHEATEVEKDYRTILLPTLLAHQQTDQEQFITIWKNLLNDIAKFSDYTSNEYSSIQQHISNSINSITPTDEYKDLADKYKSLPVIFRFDDNPNEENFGKLQPNQLAIDNLTIDSLRQRIADLEQSIKECQEKQQKIAGEMNGKKISSSTSSIQSATSNNILTTNSSNLNGVSNSIKDTKFNKDLCSLKCQERQMNKLVEIIRSSLNEVSINELSSGCDDLSVEIDKNLGTDENITSSTHMSVILQKSGDFMTLIRTPFRKKRKTVAGDELSRRSKSQTPMTVRATTKHTRSLSSSSVNSESNSNTFDVSSTNTENATKNNNYADINSVFEFDFNINSLFNDYDDYIDESQLTNVEAISALQTIEINECKHLEEQVEEIDESETIKIPDVKEKISKIHLPSIPKIFLFATHSDNVKGSVSKVQDDKQDISKEKKSLFSFFKKKNCSSTSKSLNLMSDNLKIDNDLIICRRCRKQIIYSKELLDSDRQFQCNNVDICNCEKVVDDDGIYIKNSAYKDLTVSNRPIYEEEWFHGVLPREEVVRLLRNDGDFLVRETTRNDESQTVLSVCWNGHKHFIVQTTADGHFRFEGPSFPSIQELILHQFQSELPVTSRSGAILKTPIFKEHWELSNDDVILIDKIGRGNFGDVYKAKLKSSRQDVAVKTCKHSLPEEQKRKFLQEGRILKQYDHPNIVKLIGICVQKQPIMIVMELVEGGSLLTFLRKNSTTLDQNQMMGMCRDTAAGMRYLESKNCIHRDLAARNCLIGSENIVKISDFGMSREEEEYIVSDGMKQIPIKWTAPEALNFGKYTSLCDVWSYGILIWEIFSKGGTPYPGLSNSKAREKIDEGYRMPIPEGTPPEMYKLMLKCWKEIPEERPHFDEIFTVVDCLIKKL